MVLISCSCINKTIGHSYLPLSTLLMESTTLTFDPGFVFEIFRGDNSNQQKSEEEIWSHWRWKCFAALLIYLLLAIPNYSFFCSSTTLFFCKIVALEKCSSKAKTPNKPCICMNMEIKNPKMFVRLSNCQDLNNCQWVLDKLVGSLARFYSFPPRTFRNILTQKFISIKTYKKQKFQAAMASFREISFAISCFVLLLGGALFAGLSIGIRSEYQFQSGTKIVLRTRLIQRVTTS